MKIIQFGKRTDFELKMNDERHFAEHTVRICFFFSLSKVIVIFPEKKIKSMRPRETHENLLRKLQQVIA